MNDRLHPRRILILESDAAQAAQIAAGFQGDVAVTEVITISQLEAAWDFLRGQGEYQTAGKPDLILLNFAPAQSQSLLKTLKADRQLRQIPVILLNQTEDAEVIFQSYLAQGNCYVLKSAHQGDLKAIAQHIEAFWLGVATLPTH
ncbi:response regulator [Romeriopsis navalis]|nr:response regulator [Romeriopsis navalis]